MHPDVEICFSSDSETDKEVEHEPGIVTVSLINEKKG